MKDKKITVGWQEWCALPELNLPAVKMKVDTGARTSCLHAINIETYQEQEKWFAKFDVHPVQRNNKLTRSCVAPLIDQRHVKSSSGHQEHRYVIETPIILDQKKWNIHITLTDRDAMGMRMLLGREAMIGRIIVDPSGSFYLGKTTTRQAMKKYASIN